MKKFTITLMALALVLVAMPAIADPLAEESVGVEISVAKYAEIGNIENPTYEITERSPGIINLRDYSVDYYFDVLANFDYDVKGIAVGGPSDTRGIATRDDGEEYPFTINVRNNEPNDEDWGTPRVPGVTSRYRMEVGGASWAPEGSADTFALEGDYTGEVIIQVVTD